MADEMKQSYTASELVDLRDKIMVLRSVAGFELKPLSISASKLKSFDACPRIWFADSVLGARTESQARMKGKVAHAQLENYYKHGAMLSGVAASASQFYPLRQQADPKAFELEVSFQTRWAGAIINGVIDLRCKPGTSWPHNVAPNTLWRILDLKTSSNIDEFCLKQSQLPTDRQLGIYAKATMEQHGVSLLETSQVQINRSAPYSGRMLAPELITSAMVQELEQQDTGAVSFMEAVRKEVPSITEVHDAESWTAGKRKNPCDNHFGKRCPYYEACHGRITFAQMAANATVKAESSSDVLSRLIAPVFAPMSKQEQQPKEQNNMAGITSPQASNATMAGTEGGVWSVNEKGSAQWDGTLAGHQICFKSRNRNAQISINGGEMEKLEVPDAFVVPFGQTRGSVEDLRKHLLWPALERLRKSYGLPSMFALAASAATPLAQKAEDADVLQALAAELHRGEAPQKVVDQASKAPAPDFGMLVEELKSVYPTMKPTAVEAMVTAGITLAYLKTAPKAEAIAAMEALPQCGPDRARKRFDIIAHLRADHGADSAPATTTQTPASTATTTTEAVSQTTPAAEVQQQAATVKEQAEPVKTLSEPKKIGLDIYIKCVPLSTTTITFEELIGRTAAEAAELAGAPHWSAIPGFDLSKWLHKALDQHAPDYLTTIADGRPVVVANADSPLWRALSQTLINVCSWVVVGI